MGLKDATTVQIGRATKRMLDSLKAHPRESYDDLIARMASSHSRDDKTGLVETTEILSNPALMRSIAKGIEDYEAGKTKTLSQVKKELGP